MFDPYSILGMTFAEATEVSERFGYSLLVEIEDGFEIGLALDYNIRRIHVEVENDKIVNVIGLG
jgi:hypothetical protein